MSALSSVPTRHAPEGSPEKGARLEELESTIEAGLKTFVEVGRAIREINDSRLYREQGFDTFEKYCRERWGWSRGHAYRQMEAANAAEIVSPIGDIPNEGVARELTPLRANPEAVKRHCEESKRLFHEAETILARSREARRNRRARADVPAIGNWEVV